MAGEAENGDVVSNGSDSASVKEIGLSVDAGDEACSSDIEVDEHGNIAAEGAWLAWRVKEWTHNLIDDPEDLLIHSYGKFNSSILVDEDIENEICLHLQEIELFFCAMDIVHFLKTPEMTRWLTLKKMICDYQWKREPKGQDKDGHERSDVVAYRQGGFLLTVGVLEPQMTNWGINGEALPDNIPDGERVVFWSHDESTFYTNDHHRLAKPYAKGEGASLIAADYVSPDFGWLRSPDGSRSARVLFKAGKTRDGYFTNTKIIDQASNAMDILDEYFLRFQHVFEYNNATNHKKRCRNALSALKMTVNPSPVGKPNFLYTIKESDDTELKVQMDDGRFADGTLQSLYFPESHPTLLGHFKSMQQILHEQFEHDRASPKINGQCKDFKCEEGQTDCCLCRILYNQQDFAAQKSALEEVCEAWRYTVLFFPKFHCKLNSLEQSWGFAKCIYREFLSLSKEADLEQIRFFTHTLRFMNAYRKVLNGHQAAWASKMYQRHRVLPESILEEFDKAHKKK
ncbi:hypothetical protein ARMGADRAFT_1048913 [Armillaria gallica]|uniref:Uncharacterized protein n=1 Tax=Armillaria gallica TaxID=47427 RepID=A0A2H3CQN8_ARMGA|nr:hypothetical protein ARMGADRAFT_1048913 [Armillaria gallica]